MDPREGGSTGDGGGGGGGGLAKQRGRRASRVLLRCWVSLILCLIASFLFSFLAGLLSLILGHLSKSAAVSVPSTCKILSSSVDLRSSKICELGMLNYKAKHVFYPSEKSKFRCRYDYYWASVFEVEYREHFSGQVLHAVAEAPKEALPEYCRPGFGDAWLARMKFKVNETYNCSYMLGSKKADIYQGNIFNCQAKELSTAEMIRRYLTMLKIFYTNKESSSKMMYLVAGFVSGMLASVFIIIVLRSLHLARKWCTKKDRLIPAIPTKLKRVCLLVAYFSIVGWLALQYFKMIGFKQLTLYYKISG